VGIENQNSYVIILFMDFIIGFLLGYFFKETVSYIKRLAIPTPKDWDKEWDWIEPIQEDDLP